MKEMMRTHVLLPRELVEELDRLAGQRKRSRFVEEAIAEKIAHQRQATALEQYAGILDPAKHPEWSTPEKTSAWVRKLREEADKATEGKITTRDSE